MKKFALLLTTLVFATTIWISCDDQEKGICDCWDREPSSIQIVTGVPNDTLYFAPGDSASTTVTVIVTDDLGLAYPGVKVDISLINPSLGVIEYTDDLLLDTTNALGRVNIVFRVYDEVGDQIISATTGGLTAQRILVIRQAPIEPYAIHLTVTPAQLEIDSNERDSVRVDLTIVDQNNHGIPNYNFLVSATGGTLISPSPTDSSGHTFLYWFFYNEFGEFWLRVQSGAIRDSVQVRVQEAPDLYYLTVTADPTLLEIDSDEEVHSLVTITLLDGFGQGRPNAEVNASVSGGTIPEPPLTDANGQTQFNWSFHSIGDYYLFVDYPEWGLRDTATVSIALRVHEPPQVDIHTIPATLRVDSNTVGEAFIVVTARDDNGILLPGITPTLSVQVGEFDPPPPTDANGQSQTSWRFFNNFGAFQVATSIEYNGQPASDTTFINVLYGP